MPVTLTQNIIETRTSLVHLREEWFIEMRIKNSVEIDVDDIREQFEAYEKLSLGNPFILIVFPAIENQVTQEALKFSKKLQKNKMIIAQAIITTNLAHRILARMYYAISKPTQPSKLFKNEKNAVKWLKKFR